MLCQGSGDGVRRLLDGDALLAGIHVIDDAGGCPPGDLRGRGDWWIASGAGYPLEAGHDPNV